ncbi:MAG: DegV family protein [Anaerolineae bacterium]
MVVKIVTDSTCDLPASVVAALDIRVVPLYIHVGSHAYLDGIDLSREEFYTKLPGFAEHPRTAVPSPAKLHAIYDDLASEGSDEILSIHIAESLSAMLGVARAAAQVTTIPVTVMDSRQLSLGTGFMVQRAAELARSGSTVKEILAVLEDQLKRTHVWAALDTLLFLRRSGRMNAVVSTIGEVLQIKPILTMYDGISKAERVRTHKHAIARLVEVLHKYGPFEKLAFLHSNAAAQAQNLAEQVRDLLPAGGTWFEVINPVLGAHIGPGAVGFACVSKA